MEASHIGILAALVAAAPLALAHDYGIGQAKFECETSVQQTRLHEYGPSTGFLILFGSDGSFPPCPYGDTLWDGHYEYAYGGGWLLASDGNGVTNGATLCFGTYPDHLPAELITVRDALLTEHFGGSVGFSIYADTLNNLPPVEGEPNCGDFESDFGQDCVDNCVPAFPPGLDGSYQVYISGTTGHFWTGPPPPCIDTKFYSWASPPPNLIPRKKFCNFLEVTNAPGVSSDVILYPGGGCHVPAGATVACPWFGALYAHIVGTSTDVNGSFGTYRQTG